MSDTRVKSEIRADRLIQDIVDNYPDTVLIFARHGLQCPGCYISPFHTIADTARAYAIRLEPLLEDLNRVVPGRKP